MITVGIYKVTWHTHCFPAPLLFPSQHFWNKCVPLFQTPLKCLLQKRGVWNLVTVSQMWSRTSESAIGSDQIKFLTSAAPSQTPLSVIPAVADGVLSSSNSLNLLLTLLQLGFCFGLGVFGFFFFWQLEKCFSRRDIFQALKIYICSCGVNTPSNGLLVFRPKYQKPVTANKNNRLHSTTPLPDSKCARNEWWIPSSTLRKNELRKG